jgi:Xaa-Pro aminopeptidase
VDAGAEHANGYTTDISRTWPVNGKFSGPQHELYTAVLLTQQACINAVVEGETSLGLRRLALQTLHSHLVRMVRYFFLLCVHIL